MTLRAPPLSVPGLNFPDMGSFDDDPLRGVGFIMPEPCTFLRDDQPLCSVVRPATGAHPTFEDLLSS